MRELVLVAAVAGCGGKKAAPARGSASAPPGAPAPRVPHDDVPLPDGARARLGGTSFRHAAKLEVLALSADGKLLATGAADDTLAVWDTGSGKRLYVSKGEGLMDRVDVAAFAGDALVFAHGEAGITVVSTTDWSERPLTTCGKGWTEGIAPSPDGKTLAIACENTPAIRLQPIDGGAFTPLGTLDPFKYGPIAWSADGAWIAAVTVRDGKLHLFDLANKREVPGPQLDEHPEVLAFAPRGAVLAYDDHAHYMRERVALYDVAAGKELGSYPVKVDADAIAFSRDGKRLAFGQATGNRSVIVIDLSAGTRHELVNPTRTIVGLAFADPAGSQLWIGHDRGARLWDVATDREVFGPAGHIGGISALAYGPDGKTLASGGSDGTIRLWDVAAGTSRVLDVVTDEYGVIVVEGDDDWKKFSMSAVTGLGWSNDGATLYESDGELLRSWNAATGEQLHAKGLQGIGIKAFALAPDTRRAFALGTEDSDDPGVTLRIVDADSAREQRRIDKLVSGAVAVSRDGTKLAVTSPDHVLVLDAATGAQLASVDADQVEALAFSPDAKQLAIATYSGLLVYAVTGDPVNGLGTSDWCTAVAWSPDGRVLVGTHHGSVSILDAKREGVTHDHAHHGDVHAIAVAPDGKSFATGASDGEILIWPL